MEIIRKSLPAQNIFYPVEKLGDINKILFIDIETTGFSARTSNLYLIGCMHFSGDTWNTVQFFADDYSDEKELLDSFFAFAAGFDTLIHYNGNNFDIPYILEKCKMLDLAYSFDNFTGIDIFKRVQPYRNFLKLENCKQKTIEKFLGISRDDKYNGGELITVYHEYVQDKSADKLELLLLHNYEDVIGMLALLPILAYSDLVNEKIKVTKVSANYYTDDEGCRRSELMMVFDINTPLPVPIANRADGFYFTGNGSQGLLKVPLFEEELKYFYANYHDYYYLPSEDIAIHKSVAEFVDKDYREKAKTSNCYTRKSGLFLMQWDLLVTPFFKRDYESREMFFELTKELKTDREMFSKYTTHILEHIARQ